MNETWSEVLGRGGVKLAVRKVDRPPTQDPPLLLMHGLASTQHVWDLALPRLSRRRRVVTFDARGHGLSGKPSSGYGFDPVVDDAVAVIRASRLHKPVVVGHSWGAMVALELAAREPRLVSGLVMVDGGVFRMRDDFTTWNEAKEELAPPQLAGMRVEDFKERIPRFLPFEVTQEVERIVLSVMHQSGGHIRPRLSRANHFRILRAIWEHDPTRLYPGLRVPALAILARSGGEGFAEAKQRAAHRLRGSPIRVQWMEGVHDLPLQHPRALAARIERFAAGVGG
jgi:pimeloyl-ACP methyl ester carboxylesterase